MRSFRGGLPISHSDDVIFRVAFVTFRVVVTFSGDIRAAGYLNDNSYRTLHGLS